MLHADIPENNETPKKTNEATRFKPGHGRQPHGGRKPGPNKVTRVLKEAILMAAEIVGEDGRGKNGLVGFLVAEASKPKNQPFMNLLGRVLPATLKANSSDKFHHHVTVEFVEPTRKPLEDKSKVVDVTPKHKLEEL